MTPPDDAAYGTVATDHTDRWPERGKVAPSSLAAFSSIQRSAN